VINRIPAPLALAALALLGGCNLAPKYVRPEAAVPIALPQGEGPYLPASTDAPDISTIGWRDFFLRRRANNYCGELQYDINITMHEQH